MILLLILQLYYYLLCEQDNPKYVRYLAAANIFIHFYLNDTY